LGPTDFLAELTTLRSGLTILSIFVIYREGKAVAKNVRIRGLGNPKMYVISGKLTDDSEEEKAEGNEQDKAPPPAHGLTTHRTPTKNVTDN
jgi:hypothetical protein